MGLEVITMAVMFLVFAAILLYWALRSRGESSAQKPVEARAGVVVPAPTVPPVPSELVARSEAEPRIGSEHDLEVLLQHAEVRRYASGELVFREGEDASVVCLLLSGRVGLLVETGGGRHLIVESVRPGELFAWSGAVPPYHYTATAHVVEESEVAFFGTDELHRLCEADPLLGYHFMERIAIAAGRRVRDLETQIEGLMVESPALSPPVPHA